MPQDLDRLVELCILREEVKKLKRDMLQLEREKEALANRLSQRRPTAGVTRQIKKLRQIWGDDPEERGARANGKDPSAPKPYRPLFS